MILSFLSALLVSFILLPAVGVVTEAGGGGCAKGRRALSNVSDIVFQSFQIEIGREEKSRKKLRVNMNNMNNNTQHKYQQKQQVEKRVFLLTERCFQGLADDLHKCWQETQKQAAEVILCQVTNGGVEKKKKVKRAKKLKERKMFADCLSLPCLFMATTLIGTPRRRTQDHSS